MDEIKERSSRSRKKIAKGMKKHVENMSAEAMKATLLMRKECIKKAQEIVTRLIEPNVGQEWLLENLHLINQSHFDDVVEERFLLLICGYPLCDNKLRTVPKQTYKISTKSNKVYNITERKKFCSNQCYKASKIIQEQMHTSPLWLREFEEEVIFQLYQEETPSESTGVEIDIRLTEDVILEESQEQIINDSVQSLPSEEIFQNEEKSENPPPILEIKPKTKVKKKVHFKEETLTHMLPDNDEIDRINYCPIDIRECELSENDEDGYEDDSSESNSLSEKKNDKETVEVPEIKPEVDEKDVMCNENKGSFRRKNIQEKEVSLQEVVIRIEQKVKSWVSVNTLVYLLGEECVRGLFEEAGKSLPDYSPEQASDSNAEKYDQLCKSLAIAEMKEDGEALRSKKPLPDFEQLKADAEDLKIKVQSFYRGDRVVRFEEEPKKEERELIMPLVDHHSVRATRRKILINKLTKNLPDVQSLLDFNGVDLGLQVKGLVATLNLSPTNILFRTSELPLVSIMVLKLLSLRDQNVRERWYSKTCNRSLEMLLEKFGLDIKYLDRLVSYLTEIGPFISSEEKQIPAN